MDTMTMFLTILASYWLSMWTEAIFSPPAGEVRLNHIQIIGTHNSYHVAPHPSLMKLIAAASEEAAASLDYTHLPLTDQLNLGIRQFELDVFNDPEGGHYATPGGIAAAAAAGLPVVPASLVPYEWSRPGFPVFHVVDVDFISRTPDVTAALKEVLNWSERNPGHYPVCLIFELKSSGGDTLITKPVQWSEDSLIRFEKLIVDTLGASRMIRPADVIRDGMTLNESILKHGWPTIDQCRDKFLIALDNEGIERDMYLSLYPGLVEAAIFVSVPEGQPASAFIKINDPESQFERIRKLSAQGYLIRTRADAGTSQARSDDYTRQRKAFASGAHWISTDYPIPDARFSGYATRFPSKASPYMRWNPVSAAGKAFPEQGLSRAIIPDNINSSDQMDPTRLSELAMEAHGRRSLGTASTLYARLLELEPPTDPSDDQKHFIIAMAPDLHLHAEEFFELRDVCAIHHPTRPLIAYHLMWGDDVDFPEDNDPVDHEVVWVEYNRQTGKAVNLFTYFHGSIVRRKADDDSLTNGRFQVAVEWGKHGSLPLALSSSHSGLRENHHRLNTVGTRLPDHPLARNWPKRFAGSFENYATFSEQLPLVRHIESDPLIMTGLHGNAIIDQHLLPYNFSAKPEWPGQEAQ